MLNVENVIKIIIYNSIFVLYELKYTIVYDSYNYKN